MADQHTPGPWTQHYDAERESFVIAPQSEPAAILAEVGHQDYQNDRGMNARLIAAAPAMLDALRDLVEASDAYRNSSLSAHPIAGDHARYLFGKISAARAVIAQATGIGQNVDRLA